MNETKTHKNKCYNKILKANKPCPESACRHFLNSKQSLNCSIIAADDGPKTLQEIGDYYGVSRMRICQIEKMILNKLRKNSDDFQEHETLSS
jgi:hypothetical protein